MKQIKSMTTFVQCPSAMRTKSLLEIVTGKLKFMMSTRKKELITFRGITVELVVSTGPAGC